MKKLYSVIREVRIGDEWCKVEKSSLILASGWLHYELLDGTNGLAQPKNWRYMEHRRRGTNK